MYKYVNLPKDRGLIKAVDAAASRLHEKLISAGVDTPYIDTRFRKKYLEFHLNVLPFKLTQSAYHVLWAVARCRKPLTEISLIDHGGALGFIGMLAKELGVGKVIYNDINPEFLQVAQRIAKAVGLEADRYILGDVENLVKELDGDVMDALVSYDVLEHIYNLDDFLAKLCSSSSCPRVLFMSSGANMFNPRYLSWVILKQRELELLNCCKRIAIIRNYSADLCEEHIVSLSKKTRMLLRSEIELVVDGYLKNKNLKLPKKKGINAYDPFGSNTVDHETGWWGEHLFNPFYLSKQIRRYQFKVQIRLGYRYGRGVFLNPMMRVFPVVVALPIASFYTIDAMRYSDNDF